MIDMIDNEELRLKLQKIKDAFSALTATVTVGNRQSLVSQSSKMEIHIPTATWIAMDTASGIQGEDIGLPPGRYQIGPRHYSAHGPGFGSEYTSVHIRGSLLFDGEVRTEIEFSVVASSRDESEFFRASFIEWRRQELQRFDSDIGIQFNEL